MLKINNLINIKPIPVHDIGESVILQEVEDIEYVLQEYTHYVSAGTLLGLHRDGHLIPHDTDFDIEILDDNYNYNKLNAQLEDIGLKLIRVVKYDNSYMQLAYHMQCGFIFDIYIYYKEDGVWTNHNDHGVLIVPDNILEMDEDEYCEFRYGKDWRTPKRNKGDWGEDAGQALQR